jgi:putative transposase
MQRIMHAETHPVKKRLSLCGPACRGRHQHRATRVTVEIVRKIEGQVGFQLHKRRWVVERFFAWIGRNRRFSRDVERLVASAEAFLYAAASIILLRRLARC